MRVKYKAWAKPYIDQHSDLVFSQLDFSNGFFDSGNVHLEIGFGKGDFIISLATKFPDLKFLGIEKNMTVSGIAAKKIVDSGLTNIRLYVGDIAQTFDVIPDASFNSIFLNFSDPWPKRRHTKRRLTYSDNLIQYARMLHSKGCLFVKTDKKDLYEFSLLAIKESPFQLVSTNDNYAGDDEFDAMSEYEKQFRKNGQIIYRIVARKE
ncbi:MAG: tRNA (guanosine(46)-N7)-methyltransferase TrmB [Bacilli bacterium]|jgi:tRNA (guanine-N7-)-methyltransferase